MRIRVTRSGGWSGLRLERVVDTEGLPSSVSKHLEMLLRTLPETVEGAAPRAARDARTYVVAVDGRPDAGRIVISEATSSIDQQDLLEILRDQCPSLR